MANGPTPNLFSISSLRELAIQFQHFIGRGFLALSRKSNPSLSEGPKDSFGESFGLNDGFYFINLGPLEY